MRHKLTERIIADLQRIKVKPTPAMLEAFDLLDAMATRASRAGLAAAGRSGRKKKQIDAAQVAKFASGGMSAGDIAKQIGVSPATVYRILRGDR